jgi:hypothetical protein
VSLKKHPLIAHLSPALTFFLRQASFLRTQNQLVLGSLDHCCPAWLELMDANVACVCDFLGGLRSPCYHFKAGFPFVNLRCQLLYLLCFCKILEHRWGVLYWTFKRVFSPVVIRALQWIISCFLVVEMMGSGVGSAIPSLGCHCVFSIGPDARSIAFLLERCSCYSLGSSVVNILRR